MGKRTQHPGSRVTAVGTRRRMPRNGSGAHWRGERTGIQWSRGSAEWLRTCGRRGTVGVPVAASIVRGGTQEDGE